MGVLKLFDRRFGSTGKPEPTSPKEGSSDWLNRIPVQASHGRERGGAVDEASQTRDGRGGNNIGKRDTKDDNWIVYGAGSQAKGKSGRPRIKDGRWPEDRPREQNALQPEREE